MDCFQGKPTFRRVLIGLCLIACGFGAKSLAGSVLPQDSSEVVTIQASPSAAKLSPGKTGHIRIQLEIADGYHINAQKPSESYLIATKLVMDKAKSVRFGLPVYPRAVMEKPSFSEKPLAVYQGTVEIAVPVTVAKGAKPGAQVVTGKLTFQACNDETCLPPKTVQVEVPVEIAAGK